MQPINYFTSFEAAKKDFLESENDFIKKILAIQKLTRLACEINENGYDIALCKLFKKEAENENQPVVFQELFSSLTGSVGRNIQGLQILALCYREIGITIDSFADLLLILSAKKSSGEDIQRVLSPLEQDPFFRGLIENVNQALRVVSAPFLPIVCVTKSFAWDSYLAKEERTVVGMN
ncbi:MAG: hypothetical protein V4439_03425 [Patescibacteria group bacterium]